MASTRSVALVGLGLAAVVAVASATGAVAATMITGKQIKNGTVTGADIKNGSLTGKDVRNGSITAADLAPSARIAGPRGPAGPKGGTGPAGPPGAAASAKLSTFTMPGVANGVGRTATCPAGSVVTGGSAVATYRDWSTSTTNYHYWVTGSAMNLANGWTGSVQLMATNYDTGEITQTYDPDSVVVVAVCLKLS